MKTLLNLLEEIKERNIVLGVHKRTVYMESGGIPADLAPALKKHEQYIVKAISNRTEIAEKYLIPDSVPPLDRTAKFHEAHRWLREKRLELGIAPDHAPMLEALDGKYDRLSAAWCDDDDEGFLVALREYAASGLGGLRAWEYRTLKAGKRRVEQELFGRETR